MRYEFMSVLLLYTQFVDLRYTWTRALMSFCSNKGEQWLYMLVLCLICYTSENLFYGSLVPAITLTQQRYLNDGHSLAACMV